MSPDPGRDPDAPRLRGPVKWVVVAVVALAILVLLFTVVFPWIESTLSTPTMDV